MPTVDRSFIPLPIFADEFLFGTGQLQGKELRPNGDWRDYIFAFSPQSNGFMESSSCVTYAILNAIEILSIEQFCQMPDYSERFTSTLAGTTAEGNNPQKVLETIRRAGLIPEAELPFDETITTREAYFAPVPDVLKDEGKQWLKHFTLGHDWVLTDKTRKEERRERLEDALRFSPLPVSVNAWTQHDGVFYSVGEDNHECLLIASDRDYWYVLDSYAPFLKKLEKGFEFGCAKRLTLDRRSNLFSLLWTL